MAPAARKRLSLDANILFDLAENLDAAHDFREVFQRLGYGLFVGPTVIQELHYFHEHGPDTEKSLATEALTNMLSWGIAPFDLKSVGHGLTELFAKRLIDRGLLPEGEINDGLILAETSLAGIPMLVTCDNHLLKIDRDQLAIQFNDADLFPVVALHPKALLKAVANRP